MFKRFIPVNNIAKYIGFNIYFPNLLIFGIHVISGNMETIYSIPASVPNDHVLSPNSNATLLNGKLSPIKNIKKRLSLYIFYQIQIDKFS